MKKKPTESTTDTPANNNGNANGHEPPLIQELDLDALRLPQNFADIAGVKKIVTRVPVRRPDRQWFVRVRPEPEYQLSAAILDVKEDRDVYLLMPTAYSGAGNELVRSVLHIGMTRHGVLFVWPTPLPSPEGRDNLWHASARDAVERAKQVWISVRANMAVGGYELFEATAEIPQPIWPVMSLQQILTVAFRDRVIHDPQHPVLLKLAGAR
jgi:hypothetical protein